MVAGDDKELVVGLANGAEEVFGKDEFLGRVPECCIGGLGFGRGGPHNAAAPAFDHGVD